MPGCASTLDPWPGSYALALRLDEGRCMGIGRLGEFYFPPGDYLYLGSAHGPGGLRGRLERHLRPFEQIRIHWHIDYFRQAARLTAYAWVYHNASDMARLECAWSRALSELPGSFHPAPRFGASDCRLGCVAHLVGFRVEQGAAPPSLSEIFSLLEAAAQTEDLAVNRLRFERRSIRS